MFKLGWILFLCATFKNHVLRMLHMRFLCVWITGSQEEL